MDLITMVLACSLYADNSITNAMIQVGSKNQPLTISSDSGESKTFKSQNEAVDYAMNELNDGHRIEVGLMQIPSRWFENTDRSTIVDLLSPCKNMVIATQILNHNMDKCAEINANNPNINLQACALSMYKTGDTQAGFDYANAVMSYANDHSFDKMLAAEKAKNPKKFTALPGDAHTTIATPNASKVNPSSDQTKRHIKTKTSPSQNTEVAIAEDFNSGNPPCHSCAGNNSNSQDTSDNNGNSADTQEMVNNDEQ